MTNMKYLIHQECAKHDVPSVVVESLIARIIVARAMWHTYRRTGSFVVNWRWMIGYTGQRFLDVNLLFAAQEITCKGKLTKEAVLDYITQYIRVHKTN